MFNILFIKIDGYVISRLIRNLVGRERSHAVAMMSIKLAPPLTTATMKATP